MRRTDSLVETNNGSGSTRQLRKRKGMEATAGGDAAGAGDMSGSPLPEGKVNIVRLTDANASEPAINEPVSSVQVTTNDTHPMTNDTHPMTNDTHPMTNGTHPMTDDRHP